MVLHLDDRSVGFLPTRVTTAAVETCHQLERVSHGGQGFESLELATSFKTA
jgi:hypothetical protein